MQWVSPEEFAQIDWTTLRDDSNTGYIIECDLDYPVELHYAHNDYPLAPQRLRIDDTMLGGQQRQLRVQCGIQRAESTKLCPNLLNKRKYIVHYRTLKYYLSKGLRLVAVHRALKFEQRAWIADYIELNSKARADMKASKFEQNLRKELNNTIYGKTMQNERKHTKVQILLDEEKVLQLSQKPHCRWVHQFDYDLVAVEMAKIYPKINMPFEVGFVVLELSKLLMYQHHYDFFKPRYGERASLLFTDTDSLMYHIETPDLYADIAAAKAELDTSNYDPAHPAYSNDNNKRIGLLKDETGGMPIIEFVGLRAKMYSFTYMDATGNVVDPRHKHRAKGIQYAASRRLEHRDFVRMLTEPFVQVLPNRRINAKHHEYATFNVGLFLVTLVNTFLRCTQYVIISEV